MIPKTQVSFRKGSLTHTSNNRDSLRTVSSHLFLMIYYTLLMLILFQSHQYDAQISLNNALVVVHSRLTIKLARHTNLAR